jgi:hypothetical protein
LFRCLVGGVIEEIYKLGKKNGVPKSPSFREKKYRKDIPLSDRGIGKLVQEEPDNLEEAG